MEKFRAKRMKSTINKGIVTAHFNLANFGVERLTRDIQNGARPLLWASPLGYASNIFEPRQAPSLEWRHLAKERSLGLSYMKKVPSRFLTLLCLSYP